MAGNTPREVGFAVATELLAQSGYQVPVALGAARALSEPPEPWRAHLDRPIADPKLAALWRDLPAPSLANAPAPDAAIAIGELICRHPGEITLVAIGPLTNVAHAMQLYPQMAQAVKEIVIMGGVFNVNGYIKDTNFGLDPEAARLVLNSGATITLAPLDVTTQTMLTRADLAALTQPDTPLCRYLRATTRPWIDYSRHTRHLPGCWIHDALVIAAAGAAAGHHRDVPCRCGAGRGVDARQLTPLAAGQPAPDGRHAGAAGQAGACHAAGRQRSSVGVDRRNAGPRMKRCAKAHQSSSQHRQRRVLPLPLTLLINVLRAVVEPSFSASFISFSALSISPAFTACLMPLLK